MIRMTADVSLETKQIRRRHKKKNCQSRIPYPAKMSFKHKGEINTVRHTKAERIYYRHVFLSLG